MTKRDFLLWEVLLSWFHLCFCGEGKREILSQQMTSHKKFSAYIAFKDYDSETSEDKNRRQGLISAVRNLTGKTVVSKQAFKTPYDRVIHKLFKIYFLL